MADPDERISLAVHGTWRPRSPPILDDSLVQVVIGRLAWGGQQSSHASAGHSITYLTPGGIARLWASSPLQREAKKAKADGGQGMPTSGCHTHAPFGVSCCLTGWVCGVSRNARGGRHRVAQRANHMGSKQEAAGQAWHWGEGPASKKAPRPLNPARPH